VIISLKVRVAIFSVLIGGSGQAPARKEKNKNGAGFVKNGLRLMRSALRPELLREVGDYGNGHEGR
jgi:hypothetical protein